MTSSQGFVPDPRNEHLLVYVNGELKPRAQATVSVFDAGFVLGDGVWEGIRLVEGRLRLVGPHLDRIFAGAKSIDLDIGKTRAEVEAILRQVVDANGMSDGAHLRLMVTRGVKQTPNQDPRFQVGPATIVVTAEYKVPPPELYERGLKLWTSTFRTSGPDSFDLRLNSHSRLNLIQALIQAIKAGADEALMLDPHGFVASNNATNFFVVRGAEVWTSTGRYNFCGITRGIVVGLAAARLCDFTLAEVYTADEAFATGTFGGITPVVSVDGRTIGDGRPGPVARALRARYEAELRA